MDSRTLPETKKLGFGLMRLPKKGLRINIPETERMVDRFMEAGFNYFDTAYIYNGSEAAARLALVSRYPRESFLLATKVNAVLPLPTESSAKKQFRKSLQRTGAGYFDFYLLHALMDANYRMYDKYGLWEHALARKSEGLIRHVGFSFHGSPRTLRQILKDHPETEFVQLQLNYADWENKNVTSRENYETAREFDVPIIVMEPVKGGRLANPPEKVRALMKDVDPQASYASWAIRFAASLEGVYTVLSGMSTIEQLDNNLSYMREFQPLTAREHEVIREAQEILGRSSAIQCTGCGYCVPGCPKDIPMPAVFAAANTRLSGGQIQQADAEYEEAVKGHGTPADCIECGQCERACPQNLKVISELKRVQQVLGK